MNRAPTPRDELYHTIKNNYIMMNYQDKTKDELINELQKLQHESDSVKTSYEKEIAELIIFSAKLKILKRLTL